MTRPAPLHAALAAIALAAGAVAVAFSWQPGLATFHDDSASYLVMAQAFSPWHAASAAVAAQMPLEKYPPLFPALLALLGGAFHWQWAHALVALSFAASVACLGLYAARTSGSTTAGIVAALLYIALPGVWLNMKGILSEFPYMALTFGTLAWLAAPRRERAWSRADTGVLAIFLGAAMLTRTIGFTLAVAVAVAHAAQWRRTRDTARLRGTAYAIGAAVAATIAWYLLRPAGGDDAYVSYGSGVIGRLRGEGLASIVPLVAGNARAIFEGWLNAFVIYWGEPWQPKFIAGAAIAALAIAATLRRAARVHVDGLYVMLFLAVLVAWPFPGQMYRLALPVFPLAVAMALCEGVELGQRGLGPARASRTAAYAGAIVLAFCVPALFYIADRALLAADSQPHPRTKEIMEYYRIPFRPEAEAFAARQAEGFDDMARIHDSTPAEARVMAYGPAYIALMAGRRGVALDYPHDASDFAAQVRRAHADYVYLSRVHPRDSAHRLGDPLAPARFLDGFAEAVWWRAASDGTAEAALFRVDARRVEGAR